MSRQKKLRYGYIFSFFIVLICFAGCAVLLMQNSRLPGFPADAIPATAAVSVSIVIFASVFIYELIGRRLSKNKKIMLDDLELSENEKIIKVYYPKSIFGSIFYVFDNRTALVITDKRVILRGVLKVSHREINLEDISEVFKVFPVGRFTGRLDILKKGELPAFIGEGISVDYEGADMYVPYFYCEWLMRQDLDEAFSLIKEKIKK